MIQTLEGHTSAILRMNLRSYNISLQLEFSKQSLAYSIFLIRRRNEYSAISDLAIHELLDRLLHKIFV